jgi:regulator of protease activity HflC (stomatin/prohibitin superfamily)
LAKAVKEVKDLSSALRTCVEILVADPQAIQRQQAQVEDSWGVDIEEVRIKTLGTSHTVNRSIAKRASDIAEADGLATAAARKAEGERDRLRTEAEGTAEAMERIATAERTRLEQEGQGQAAALAARAEVLTTDGGRMIATIDAWKTGLENGNVVIVPTDMGGLAGMVMGGQALLKDVGKGSTTPPATKP